MLFFNMVENHFGSSYKIHLLRDGHLPKNVQPKCFWGQESAERFINSLNEPPGFWRSLLYELDFSLSGFNRNINTVQELSSLLIQNRFQFVEIDALDPATSPLSKRTIATPDGVQYCFEPPSIQLIEKHRELKTFTNLNAAKVFLSDLNATDVQLQSIITALKLSASQVSSFRGAKPEQDALAIIAENLISETVILLVSRPQTMAKAKAEEPLRRSFSETSTRAMNRGDERDESNESDNKLPASRLPKPPQSKAETLLRMEQATTKVAACRAAKQALPSSPYNTADKAAIVEQGLNEKFIVRVIETKYAGDTGNIGYLPEGTSTATYWTTTYTQLEYADKDAELIASAVGIDYDPDASYTLLLIDQELADLKGDMMSFIPTYGNLSEFAQKELAHKFKGYEHLIEPSMTPEYSEAYERVYLTAKQDGIDLDKKQRFNEHAQNLGYDTEQRRLLKVRHQMKSILGANEQFLGNGMTKDNTANNTVTPFGRPKIGQDYGPLETFTYDKNPQTLGKLERAGIVTRIPLNKA